MKKKVAFLVFDWADAGAATRF